MKRSNCILMMIATVGLSACSGGRKMEVRAVGEQRVLQPADLASAQALFRRGEYALAIEAYRRLLRVQPDNADIYNGLAVSYAALGRHDVSCRFFELALSLDPASVKVRRNYALSLERQGRVEDARVLLAQGGERAVPSRMRLAQIATRALSTDAREQQLAAGPYLDRRSDRDVQLSTARPDRSAALGTWASSLSVKIIDRPAEDKPGQAAAPEEDTVEKPADDAAGDRKRLSVNSIGRDRGFARLWTRIRDMEAGG